MLTRDDHLYRFRRLVLREPRATTPPRRRELLGPGYDELARAVIAVLDRNKNAAALLRGVAPKFLGDPLYVFARVHLLLRSDQPIEAARFLLGSQPDLDLSGDGDIWWDERQDLSRALLDRGTPDLAYRVVADARPEGEGDRVAAAFHAGWYRAALPPRPEPRRAAFPRAAHARDAAAHAVARLLLARPHARGGEAHDAAARLDYVEAARFGGTFYGQLAREKLGIDDDRA